MKYGFVKVAAVTPRINIAEVRSNASVIRSQMGKVVEEGAKIVVFPELVITGASCGDLFFQSNLLKMAEEELVKIAKCSKHYDAVFFVGLPYQIGSKIYSVAAVVSKGEILGLVPKSYVSSNRYFESGANLDTEEVIIDGQFVPVGTDLLFYCPNMPELKIAVELGEDFWAPQSPCVRHALGGANVIVTLAAEEEVTKKDEYRRMHMMDQSARLMCGYVLASAGFGESTQDIVYSGHNIIAEAGQILAESERMGTGVLYYDIDVNRLECDRRRNPLFKTEETHMWIPVELDVTDTKLSRVIAKSPFVPENPESCKKRCEDVFRIQVEGLKRRLYMLGKFASDAAVIGISGGLDSTLALLVTAKAFDLLGKERSDIIAVTMPGFGTTDRTYDNAVAMIKELGATFREIDIKASVRQHFADIGHDENIHNVTYENSQARERTQILMDIANMEHGIVVGTGDMSELALGWATYNGDHMSNYGVNASVPKTLVRHLVKYYADTCGNESLAAVLYDVLDTPVSPELLPPEENGEIAQKTEDLVGPYELHDFFMYYVLRFGFAPSKVFYLTQKAFGDKYSYEEIRKWLRNFYNRFFSQQFKRSCLPEGPKVGVLSLSPRGDLQMPSEACQRIWLDEVEMMTFLQ